MMVSDNSLQHKKQAFLAAYRECGNIRQAAEAAKVRRQSHYEWLKADPEYAVAVEKAEEDAADMLEQEARRRAIEGVRRMKFGRNGEPLINPETGTPYTEHEYSDTLLIFLLKGIRPDKYRENVRQEITGKNGGPVQVTTLSPEEVERLYERYRQRHTSQRHTEPPGEYPNG